MINIGVIVAMDKEYEQFKDMQTVSCPTDISIRVVKSGIGKVNAAIITDRLIQSFKPHIVISTGVAGGIGKGINVLDTIAAQTISYHDVWCGQGNEYGQIQGMPMYYNAPEKLIEKIKKMNISSLKTGFVVSGDCFVDSKLKAKQIKERFPLSDVVDMESGAIAQTCYLNHTHFLSLRTISDLPLEDCVNNQYGDFWSKLSDKSFLSAQRVINSITLEDLQ